MSAEYIATFYSHFGAVRFKKLCGEKGLSAKMAPVPRDLSSSCGTCVRFHGEYDFTSGYPEEIEQLVHKEEDGYTVLYRAENS